MGRKPQLESKPQQQTLSIRISDGLREFLERSKQLIANGRGELLSTSDVAKILLESAKEDRNDFRLEAAELQRNVTDSLWTVRRKWEQHLDLSRPEWILLGQYIQIACEQVMEDTESPTSKESLVVLLEALLAVRELRPGRGVGLDRYYLGNIGTMGEAAEMAWNDRQLDPEIVPSISRRWIEQLRTTSLPQRPTFAGRNFAVALRDEDLPDIVALNQALRPYLPTLFRLAARGHWAREKRPVRSPQEPRFEHTVIPAVRGEGFKIDFNVGSQGDLSILLSMDQKDVSYSIAPYTEIKEFLVMLEKIAPGTTWNGVHFLAYTTESGRYGFRRRAEGVLFGFSKEEWSELRSLFRRALAAPNLQSLLSELSLVYGEL